MAIQSQINSANRLVLIESDEEIIVAWADNPEDWVARFKKDGDFPASYWASRMQSLYAETSPISQSETDES